MKTVSWPGLLDVVDIALVSVLMYSVYSLFRGTRAARVLIGVSAVGVLYIMARYLDLGVTVKILQAFFAVIIIALIVIFQDEFRRLFERIGDNWWLAKARRGGRRVVSTAERRIQILVDTVSDLANQRVGALIVLEGSTSVLDLLSGGIPLNGQLSESIIKSIFDPHSQGHDGAIIISGDTIKRFACHLPLSTDPGQVAELGTRHSAGLGITERTDALCVIVSEERGSVAVARDGVLTSLEQPVALAGILRDFYVPNESESGSKWTGNLVPKALSVVLAIILWILVVRVPAGD